MVPNVSEKRKRTARGTEMVCEKPGANLSQDIMTICIIITYKNLPYVAEQSGTW